MMLNITEILIKGGVVGFEGLVFFLMLTRSVKFITKSPDPKEYSHISQSNRNQRIDQDFIEQRKLGVFAFKYITLPILLISVVLLAMVYGAQTKETFKEPIEIETKQDQKLITAETGP